MVEAGWVERRADPADRRVRMIHATEKTRALKAMFVSIADEVYAEALTGIAPADQATMIAGLRRLVANLQENEQAAAAAEVEGLRQ
jgi:DNA-binding MarR family transcriptional regulator